MSKTNEEILEGYATYFSNLKNILQDDVIVLITNRTHRLHYFRGFKLHVDLSGIGDEIRNDDPKTQAMNSDKILAYVVDRVDLFGFPFFSVDYPVHNDQGEVIGCISIGRSLEKEQRVEEISQSLAATFEQVNASLQEVASGSQGLSESIRHVVQSASETSAKIQEINKIVTAISDISNHSNLLGLNAAIEAARAGEHGKGFSVVAEEMRKLAAESKQSAASVTEILLQMKTSIEKIAAAIEQVNIIAENQAAATQEITAAMEDVGERSLNLVDVVKINRTE
ncbi:methyl-accepting chemotaxis protein [Dehalobacter sp. DCM]|uniref:methyl-accepting chemotaxis protein n=1 Tax=Dehalobacter sp. DCM TaxID=2907827 RepID=UPI00308198FE|nr:methyl-accepting chemotaxis protein [Dehalobacter sp. DCM]